MKITPSQAREVVARLDLSGGNAAHAAHQCGLELIALGSYTCRALSHTMRLLRYLDAHPQHVDAVRAHAQKEQR